MLYEAQAAALPRSLWDRGTWAGASTVGRMADLWSHRCHSGRGVQLNAILVGRTVVHAE
jgi:hypothetical protein